VTDGQREDFPEGMEVFTLPRPKYFWMNPLMQHIPLDMIAGYIAELKGVMAFRQDDERYTKMGDQRGSQIVII
jgi:hypothetical protein